MTQVPFRLRKEPEGHDYNPLLALFWICMGGGLVNQKFQVHEFQIKNCCLDGLRTDFVHLLKYLLIVNNY